MILTHPIQAEYCKPLIGQPVCIVLHDGTEHIGLVSRLEGGKIILNDTPGIDISTSKRAKKKPVKKARKNAAAVSAWGYPAFPFFGPRLALDLASIALLFLLFI